MCQRSTLTNSSSRTTYAPETYTYTWRLFRCSQINKILIARTKQNWICLEVIWEEKEEENDKKDTTNYCDEWEEDSLAPSQYQYIQINDI